MPDMSVRFGKIYGKLNRWKTLPVSIWPILNLLDFLMVCFSTRLGMSFGGSCIIFIGWVPPSFHGGFSLIILVVVIWAKSTFLGKKWPSHEPENLKTPFWNFANFMPRFWPSWPGYFNTHAQITLIVRKWVRVWPFAGLNALSDS